MEDLNAKMSDVISPLAAALKRDGFANCVYPFWVDGGKSIQVNLYYGFLDHKMIAGLLKIADETGSVLKLNINTHRPAIEVAITKVVTIK